MDIQGYAYVDISDYVGICPNVQNQIVENMENKMEPLQICGFLPY